MSKTSLQLLLFLVLASVSAWVSAETVRDDFTTSSYSRQDGTANWSNNWQDTSNGDPSSGRFRVVTTVGGRMRLRPTAADTMSRSADLTAAAGGSATLTFDLTSSGNLEAADQINVQIASSSAGPFTTLASYTGDQTVTGSFDVSAFIAADTTLRFTFGPNGANSEYFYFDFVQIDFSAPAPPAAQGCGIQTINEGFELPDILNTPPTPFQTFTAAIKAYNQGDVPGWSTSSVANPQIEIWHNNSGVTAPEGDQFAELNAYDVAALFQDLVTVPGQNISYSFKHRGRAGIDTMRLLAGPPGAAVQVGPNYSTANTGWATYSGNYTVPAGQTLTRFQYESVSGGTSGSGNFLDDIQFIVECDFGDAPDTYSTLEASNGARHTVTPNLYFGSSPPDDDFPLYAGGTGFVGNGLDDDTSGVDDEQTALPTAYDGVINFTMPVPVTNITGSTANVYGWIDFDRNGTFEADEVASTTVATGVTGGSVNLTWTGLGTSGADVSPGASYLRLRMSTNAMDADSDVGPLNDGEVEDHALTIQNALTAATAKSFSPASIQVGETTTMTLTLTNPHAFPLTGVTISDNMPGTMWLDSLTLGGTCTNFAITTGTLGSSNIVLTGGQIPASTSCTIDLQVMSSVVGSHDNTTSGHSSNELVTGPVSNTAQLTVTSSPSAVCTPGDLGSGSINYSDDDDLFSLNLATGKVEILTTAPAANVPSGVVNSVAVDPRNYIIYYVDNTGTSTNASIFGFDMLAGTHFTVEADVVTNHGLSLGARGLGSGGATFFGGSLYLGIEERGASNDEVVFRLQMSNDGRSVRYAQEILTLPATEFGDLVVTGSDLLVFDAGNDLYRRYDLATLTLQVTAGPNTVYSQGGAQRDGSTLWAVSNVIQKVTVATGALQGLPITLTTDGTTPAGTAADSAGCVPTTSRVGDLIWNDTDLDGVKDSNEIGISNVTIDLYYDLNGDGALTAADDITGDNAITLADRIQTVTSASDGSYHFHNLVPDDYIISVTDTSNVLGGATPTNTASNMQAVTNLTTNEERNSIDFGYSSFMVIEGGKVFNDNGAGGGTAHDGIKQSNEAGFEGVLVRALDPSNGNAVITSTLTSSDGSYTLYIPNSFTGNAIDIVADTVSGFRSVSESVGTSGATNPDTRDDKITFTPLAGVVYTGVNFGDVALNKFTPSNTGTVQAGQVVFYAHEYIAGTAGSVTFSSAAIATPGGLTWQHVLYNDVDCSGDLSAAESAAPVAANIALVADQKICLLNKVFAPTSAPFSAQYVTTLTADFSYTGETPDGLVDQLIINDLTTLSAAGLVLEKTVENINAGTGAVISNTALPGQQLRYTVTYTNNSTGAISSLVVRDSVPAYTRLQAPVTCPVALPNNLTACTLVLPIPANNLMNYNGPIEWSFTGTLGAGQQGSLSFDVLVE